MNQKDWLERLRKREQRSAYREWRVEREQGDRGRKREAKEKKKLAYEAAASVLRADNKKSGKTGKKPGPGAFLAQYAYIPRTAFDARDSIPTGWRPKSFNKRKQHREFFKKFVWPYPLPETLLWAALEPEHALDDNGERRGHPGIIRLAKKWVADIASGGSFFKRNKTFFTKAEAHRFLCSNVPYEGCGSVIKLYFYAKCRARGLNNRLSLMTADVFSEKFPSRYKNRLVESFLGLIAREPDYRHDRGTLGDLCDFVLAKIPEAGKEKFSFGGRTVGSAIRLANEWHERLGREAEARRAHDGKPACASKWEGLGLPTFRYEADGRLWTVAELRTTKDLLNEGRKMRNCVSFYAGRCANGDSSIFTVDCAFASEKHPFDQSVEKVATLEVMVANRTLVQAKGKCNGAVVQKAKNVIARWAAANRIAVRPQV